MPPLETLKFQDPRLGEFGEITMEYRVETGNGQGRHVIAVSIDGRTLPLPNLVPPSSIPPNAETVFLFESEILAARSDSSRQRLVLPDSVSESDLFRALRSRVSSVLNQRLPEIEQRNTQTREHFEQRYPHLTGYFDADSVGIIDREEALEMAQTRFFRAQKTLLESDTMDDRLFQQSLEFSSRALTEYILYRERIIGRLRDVTKDDAESRIHDLIAPRGQEFTGDSFLDDLYSNNAWLLDDKFMSFRTILSNKRMDEVVQAIALDGDAPEERGVPDISMVFSQDPDEGEKVEVVIVELKKRTTDHKENTYAHTQLLQRARKLINYCPEIQRAWYFGVIEIDDELDVLLRDDQWTPLFSRGRVYYRDRRLERDDGAMVPVPICLLSFDAVIEDAVLRNHTFLEILRGDMRKIGAKHAQAGD